MKPKPTIVVQKRQPKPPYFCFDHGIGYGSDGLMCPECERDICEQHDPAVQPK